MLFNSVSFILFFLPITICVYYWLIRKRVIMGARLWLVGASLFFYAYWNVYYLPLILISMAVNFTIGSTISSAETRINKKALLILGITLNVLALGYFKYTDFLISNVNHLFAADIPLQHIALPLAISFFTFQQIAYLVDCYKKLTKEYDLLSYALFVSFFPQLIAGPIVAHYEMMPQFQKIGNLAKNYKHIFLGIIIFIIGLAKKVIIADNFAKYATLGFDEVQTLTFWGGWFSSLAYTVQIYFDFSGYCDMAIGAALMFNINLPINFNSPYKALSIKDFWSRWHITLSRFLRDYLYIPFGGNRKGEARACLNVFLVFLIGGLWHGAAWTFVIWGALHGIASVIYRLWQKTHIHLNKFIAWFITFNFINVAWVFFRAKSFADAKKVLSAMVDFTYTPNFWHIKENLNGFHAHSSTFIRLLAIVILCTVLPNSIEILRKLKSTTLSKKYAYFIGVGLALVSIALLAKIIIVPYTEFIYFNF